MVYMGSKNRFSKELVPIIQSYINDKTEGYLEPFVGGANIIDKIKCDRKFGSDLNKYLIALLDKISNSTDELPEKITEEEYQNTKNNKNEFDDWYVGLVGFCATFGAKFFGGYGREKDKKDLTKKKSISTERIKNLKKQAPNLKGIVFKNCVFQEIGRASCRERV